MSLLSRLLKQSRGQTVQRSSRRSSSSTRRSSMPSSSKRRYDPLIMSSEVNKMRFVLLDNLRGCCSFCLSPDEIHFGVNSAEREPRLENQQHAAVEQKASAH